MVQVAIPIGLYWPRISGVQAAAAGTMDATAEKIALIGHCYIDGRPGSAKTFGGGSSDITFRTGAVTFANGSTTIDIGLQDVSASGPPQPDGTFDAKRTLVGGTDTITATAFNTFTIDSANGTKSVTHGDLIAVVLDMTARAGVNSVIVNALNNTNVGGVSGNFGRPTTNAFTASWASSGANCPYVVVTFSDGTIGYLDGGFPYFQGSPTSFSDSSNPDEYGNSFQIPFDCKVDSLLYAEESSGSDTTSDFTLNLWSDPLGSPSSLASVTVLKEQWSPSFNDPIGVFTLATPITLSKNTTYGVSLKATAAGTIAPSLKLYADAAHRAFDLPGTTVAGMSRNNSSGAFSATGASTTQIFNMGVRISSIDDGTGSGAAAASVPMRGLGLPNLNWR